MGTSRLALGLGALALLGLAAALVFGGGNDGDGASSSRPRDVPDGAPQEALTLTGLPSVKAGAETADAEADADDSEPEAEPEVEPTGPVPDPLQVGPCRLALELVDDTPAAAPVQTEVQLWRIDAPGNTGWMRGDQFQGRAESQAEGLVTFEDLPEGRYRLFVRGLRDGAEDPAELSVGIDDPLRRVVLSMPRRFAVWLQVVDAQGLALRESQATFISASCWGAAWTLPTWSKPRLPTSDPVERPYAASPSGSVRGCGNGKASTRTATPLGFEVSDTEVTRGGVSETSYFFDFEAGCGTSLHVHSSEEGPEGDRTYVSVAVPPESLAANVLLPDGRRALEAGAKVRASARATRLQSDDLPDAWRRVPVVVTVDLDGYRRLRFETDLEGAAPRWTMEPLEAASDETLGNEPLRLERRGEGAPAQSPLGR